MHCISGTVPERSAQFILSNACPYGFASFYAGKPLLGRGDDSSGALLSSEPSAPSRSITDSNALPSCGCGAS